jgi:hypothetical protein
MRTLLLLAALHLVACASNVADTSDEASSATSGESVGSVPVVSFNADWSVTSSGPITSGGKVTIHYDVARQPQCRAWYHGYEAWGLVAFFAVDGGFARSVPVTTLVGNAQQPIDVTIDVPVGKRLSLWFHASDEGGCSTWDSNYGANFVFPLVQDAPVIHFGADWSTRVDGGLHAGEDVLLDYDLSRLSACRTTYNGYQTWDVIAHYRFDGGEVHDASVTTLLSDYERVAGPARITVPDGARSLEIWFENTDRTSCDTWDSRYGANYVFSL